jgi:adenine-specific DNA-methyltransferase
MPTALWAVLRNRLLGGFKFRRQATIEPFMVDFLCVEAALVIELGND